MQLRRITAAEVGELAQFAIDGMRADLYPLAVSRQKVVAVVEAFLHDAPDRFQLAAFDDRGRIVGGVAAVVAPMLWFERSEAHVVMCRATLPGAGAKLLRALRTWADRDFSIRRVVWPMEFHADPRVAKLAARLGFDNQLTVCSYYKGM